MNIFKEIFVNQKIAENFKPNRFKYNITFMLAYKTYAINKKDNKKLWHATSWHKDKPFSKNTLKLIIPIDEISKRHGGIEIYPKKLRSDDLNKKIFKMIAKNEILIFQSNLCFHRAGNPDKEM